MIEANIIQAAYLYKVTKLLFLGPSCIYPKIVLQPLKKEYLLSKYFELTIYIPLKKITGKKCVVVIGLSMFLILFL